MIEAQADDYARSDEVVRWGNIEIVVPERRCDDETCALCHGPPGPFSWISFEHETLRFRLLDQ